jgi:hypothetical protein
MHAVFASGVAFSSGGETPRFTFDWLQLRSLWRVVLPPLLAMNINRLKLLTQIINFNDFMIFLIKWRDFK